MTRTPSPIQFCLSAAFAFFGLMTFAHAVGEDLMPLDFVRLEEVDPTIIQEIRFAGRHNFVGRPIAGYKAGKCILSNRAAYALAALQAELKPKSLSLKVYDCYRPKAAVDDFLTWRKSPNDLKMKKEFYPTISKDEIFSSGYISSKSSHSRGSTVDLTIVPLPPAKQEEFTTHSRLQSCNAPQKQRFHDNSLDMGTGFDCFDQLSSTDNPQVTPEQAKNRKLLKSLMEKYGFRNMASEWWHFTLNNEPYRDVYFEFDIKEKKPTSHN